MIILEYDECYELLEMEEALKKADIYMYAKQYGRCIRLPAGYCRDR